MIRYVLAPAFVLNFFHVLYNVACGFCSSKKEFFPTMRLIAKKIWSIFHAAIIIKVNENRWSRLVRNVNWMVDQIRGKVRIIFCDEFLLNHDMKGCKSKFVIP